jgi:hypothetical protein
MDYGSQIQIKIILLKNFLELQILSTDRHINDIYIYKGGGHVARMERRIMRIRFCGESQKERDH